MKIDAAVMTIYLLCNLLCPFLSLHGGKLCLHVAGEENFAADIGWGSWLIVLVFYYFSEIVEGILVILFGYLTVDNATHVINNDGHRTAI